MHITLERRRGYNNYQGYYWTIEADEHFIVSVDFLLSPIKLDPVIDEDDIRIEESIVFIEELCT